MTIRRIISRPGLVLGIFLILAFVVVAIAAPKIAPPEADDPYVLPHDGFSQSPQPPSRAHLLGTFPGQYDAFYGIVWGTRVALRVGLYIVLGRVLIGIPLGLISGYAGNLLDAVMMRITDAFLAFPTMAATLVILGLFGGGWVGIQTGGADRVVMLSLILFGWMQYARLVRGNVLVEREKEYVKAAVSIGASGKRIVFRHIMPNATQGLWVLIASDIGAMVVLTAVFNFIGLSARTEPLADWGQLLNLSRNWIIGTPATAFKYWFLYLPPSIAIVLFSIGWNLIGDGLHDVLNPRSRMLAHRSSRQVQRRPRTR